MPQPKNCSLNEVFLPANTDKGVCNALLVHAHEIHARAYLEVEVEVEVEVDMEREKEMEVEMEHYVTQA